MEADRNLNLNSSIECAAMHHFDMAYPGDDHHVRMFSANLKAGTASMQDGSGHNGEGKCLGKTIRIPSGEAYFTQAAATWSGWEYVDTDWHDPSNHAIFLKGFSIGHAGKDSHVKAFGSLVKWNDEAKKGDIHLFLRDAHDKAESDGKVDGHSNVDAYAVYGKI